MTDAGIDLTTLTHDLAEQAAALAHAVVPELATTSEVADLVELVLTLDAELRGRAPTLLAHASLRRLIDVASELYGRVPFGHPAGVEALTVVTSAEGIAQVLRRRAAATAATEVSAPFRRVRPEDCVPVAG